MKKSDEKKIRDAWKSFENAAAQFSKACTRCCDLPLWAFRADAVNSVTRGIEKVTKILNRIADDAESMLKMLEKS